MLPNFITSTNIIVNDCEIFCYYKGHQSKHIPSTGRLNSDGLLIQFDSIVPMDRMKVLIKSFSGNILNKHVAGLAEIEVNAKIAYDEYTFTDPIENPNTYYLNQNYPNPFNPTTKIIFSLAKPEFTTLEVFDITGRSVALLVSGQITEGVHTIDFSANPNFASGVYFYRLSTPSFTQAKKMLLVK